MLRISEKLADGDVRGAIRLAASDDTMAKHDEHTLAALHLKHPSRAVHSLTVVRPMLQHGSTRVNHLSTTVDGLTRT